MKRRSFPPEITRVVRLLKGELKAQEVEVERVAEEDPWPDRFRIAVVAKTFNGIPHLKRQDIVWEIVDRVLSREESLAISGILAFSPNELQRQTRA